MGYLSLEEHNPYTSEVHVMGILKGFRGQGVGSELLRLAEEEISGRTHISISCWSRHWAILIPIPVTGGLGTSIEKWASTLYKS